LGSDALVCLWLHCGATTLTLPSPASGPIEGEGKNIVLAIERHSNVGAPQNLSGMKMRIDGTLRR